MIGLARSRAGHHWSYDRVVLEEPFSLGYPYVFEADGQYYMMPETLELKEVCVFESHHFVWVVVCSDIYFCVCVCVTCALALGATVSGAGLPLQLGESCHHHLWFDSLSFVLTPHTPSARISRSFVLCVVLCYVVLCCGLLQAMHLWTLRWCVTTIVGTCSHVFTTRTYTSTLPLSCSVDGWYTPPLPLY